MSDPSQSVLTTVFTAPGADTSDPGRSSGGPVLPSPRAMATLRPLAQDAVALAGDGLFGVWQRRNAAATLPHCLRMLEEHGALSNLRRPAAGDAKTALDAPAAPVHTGMWFSDSDIYKTLEAASWRLAAVPGDAEVRGSFEAIVDVLETSQESDGYLNSYFQAGDRERRWRELSTSHELYCAGHLIQAAVAAHRAGIGARLMAIARRLADLIVAEFGAGGRDAVCGHPEIETALVELYRSTGHEPYLDTARRFVELRGHGLLGDGQFGAAYFQDHVPVRQASEFTGHAVRQLYLLAGVVDVAVETGDDQLLTAAERLWDSAFATKTYITGGHGSRHRDEAVGDPYELPPDRAYAETCAAIGSFQWNWRMLLATGAHRYAEEMERVLYNALAVAIGADGRHFFYSNPLQLRTGHDGSGEDAPSQRLPWYGCACCPPNLARLVASLHCYLATNDENGLQIHLYAAGVVDDGRHRVEIATGYPWDGAVRLVVHSAVEDPWTLALRLPTWCAESAVLIDGVVADVRPVDGYLRVTRVWSGQVVELTLTMPPRILAPHPRIDAVRGCVALARGPLIYSIEQADLPEATILEDVTLDPSLPVEVLGHGSRAMIPVSLTAGGAVRDTTPGALYRTFGTGTGTGTGQRPAPIALTAVPYFLWGNRRPGPMRVWIPAAGAPATQRQPTD